MDIDDAGRLVAGLSVRRLGRVAMYSGLFLSGVFLIISPSELVAGEVSHIVDRAWSISMVISSLTCLAGSLTDRWFGEYAGIPLLASVIAFYGLAAMLSADIEVNWVSLFWIVSVPQLYGSLTLVAFSLLILSFSGGLWARWMDVRSIKNGAEAVGRENGGA